MNGVSITSLKLSVSILLATLFFAVGLVTLARAAINEQISFYGTLQDTSGNDLSGTYDMVFRFYDAASGGTLLDTSTHTAGNGNAVTVTDGEFEVMLGSGAGNTLDGIDFDAAAIYVGLTIGADSEMTPRKRLAAAAYAFNSDTVDGYEANQLLRYNATGTISVTDTDTALTLVQSGTGDILNVFDGTTEVFTVLNGGNVGVGTSTPVHTFSVEGDMYLTGALYDNNHSAGTNGYVLQSNGSGFTWVSTSSLNIVATSPLGASIDESELNILGSPTDGYVLQASSTAAGGFAWVATSSLNISGGGGGSLFTDGGATTYLTSLSDNLAIGSTSAPTKLSVAGNINLDGNYGLSINGTRYFYASSTAHNLLIGESAGALMTNATTYNIAIGYRAMNSASNSASDFNVALGYEAGLNNSNDSNIFMGYTAGRSNSGYGNTLLGYQTGEFNSNNDGQFIGYRAGRNNTGYGNQFIGLEAGVFNTGDSNVGIGEGAANANTGNYNLLLGWYAGGSNAGNNNVLLGPLAGGSNGGDFNVSLGDQAGETNTGDHNTFIGNRAGERNDGSGNAFIGFDTGAYNLFGSYNSYIGYQTATYMTATSSDIIGTEAFYGGTVFSAVNNVALGYRAGYNAKTGADNNILIGYQAADNLTTGANNIVIGYNIDLASSTNDRQLVIGNLIYGNSIDGTGTTISSGNIGIGTSTTAQKLTVAGNIRVGASTGLGCIEDYDGTLIGGTCSSDERLKTNIVALSEGRSEPVLEGLLALRPVTYNWNQYAVGEFSKNPNMANIGLIAQNVEASFPELIVDNDGIKNVRFSALPFYLLQGLRELWSVVTGNTAAIEELQTELRTSEATIAELRDRLEVLESKHSIEYVAPAVNTAMEEADYSTNEDVPVVEDNEVLTEDDIEIADDSMPTADESSEQPESDEGVETQIPEESEVEQTNEALAASEAGEDEPQTVTENVVEASSETDTAYDETTTD